MLRMGESWHNLHHADPTCARHGVLRGQIDISARVIWIVREARLGARREVARPGDGWPPSARGRLTAAMMPGDATRPSVRATARATAAVDQRRGAAAACG